MAAGWGEGGVVDVREGTTGAGELDGEAVERLRSEVNGLPVLLHCR